MVDTFDLVGKKKKVADVDIYLSAPRDPEDPSVLIEGMSNVVLGGNYFSSGDTYSGLKGDVDKVRVALGKNWDFRQKNQGGQKEFDNDWVAPKLFYGEPVSLEYCHPSPQAVDGQEAIYSGLDMALSEDLLLKCEVSHMKTLGDPLLGPILANAIPVNWLYYMKIGLGDNNPTGKVLHPLVRTDHYFFDHYHETTLPLTPDDLQSKQPSGKSFFADYSTYYNERIESSAYEQALQENLAAHRSIPSIYGFLRLLNNQNYITSGYFDFSLLNEIGGSIPVLLEQNPLEELISIYGFVGQSNPEIFSKIISSDFSKVDGDALFEEYFDTWTQQSIRLVPSNIRDPLEKKFNNLVFSPRVLQATNLMEKYKNYFPFYCQLEFTAKLLTSIGDSMRDMHMTKFFSDLAASIEYPNLYNNQGVLNSLNPPNPHGLWGSVKRFIEYSEENIYENLISSGEYAGSVELSEKSISSPSSKKTLDLPPTLNYWASGADATDALFGPIGDDPETVVQKYSAYLRNDFSEPVNLDSEDNTIWKTIFGQGFKLKLYQIYKDKRRSFKDIMDGQPAYTEDIFYKIRKSVKPAGEDSFRTIQTILVPNTSELDIVKFVDTQVKYETAATYKYDVFAHRIVFGSKYRYMWINKFGNYEYLPQTDDLPPGSVVNPDGADPLKLVGVHTNLTYNTNQDSPPGGGTSGGNPNSPPPLGGPISGTGESFAGNLGETGAEIDLTTAGEDLQQVYPEMIHCYANLKVEVEPSIRIIEDKIFSTPEIYIMDKPPVTPDINIIPYRAVNNRVKILLSANVDRYRDIPVILLDEDQDEFDRVKAAQLSYDGKVEFGSDNPTTRFQIFRTQVRPTVYSDFELYQDINNAVFEESILPNTKYYYTFRAVDDHGHLSNPTPVYEVELIDEKGAVKPIIRMISMEQKQNKTSIKEAQKYIYLKPSQRQLFFSGSPQVDSIFSNESKKKRYKMRLKSKGSGKKIDINFSFRKKTQIET